MSQVIDSGAYPLAAIVGQKKMLQALLLLAIDPSIGGLLLVGEKGTAKSTAARALAEVMPLIYDGSRAPFRTIPLGVSEDRLLGGLDWEKTFRSGHPILKPGILGQANEGLVYIDEVNLLDVSLAHLILDVSSSGKIILERDGFSSICPARIALLATMNPEEGLLGPQLADRFALTVYLESEKDPLARAELIKRRLAFELNPNAFRESFRQQTEKLKKNIIHARKILPLVHLNSESRILIAKLAANARIAGHRGDLALAKAAKTLAALSNLKVAGPNQVFEVADMIIPTRRRAEKQKTVQKINIDRVEKATEKKDEFETVYVCNAHEAPPESKDGDGDGPQDMVLTVFKSENTYNITSPQRKRDVGPKGFSGRRQSRETLKCTGRSYRTSSARLGRPLSLSATLRAAAPYQVNRRGIDDNSIILSPADFREKVYRQKTGRLVIFVVDSSGSIGTLYRMEEAKAAALSLLTEAYQKRDRVALIAFYGIKAEMLLPPTNSPDMAARLLKELPSGGKTPMAAALVMTNKLLRMEMTKDPAINPYIILMTDGRPNIPLEQGVNPWKEVLSMAGLMSADRRLRFLLIDTDRGAYNDYKLTRDLADRLHAPLIKLDQLREGKLSAWLNNYDCQ